MISNQRTSNLNASLTPSLLPDLIEIINQYDKIGFTPFAAYKIKNKNEYLIISSPGQYETNCADVTKRLAAHIISPPDHARQLILKDVFASRRLLQDADYTFQMEASDSKDQSNEIVFHTDDYTVSLNALMAAGFSREFFHRININCSPILSVDSDAKQAAQLKTAIDKDDYDAVTHLIIRNHVSPNTRDDKGMPMLVYAVDTERSNAIKALVDNGANIEARTPENDDCKTALYTAVTKYSNVFKPKSLVLENIIRYLVEQKADVNARSIKGTTCLHNLVLVWTDNIKLIQLFLDHNADPTLTDLTDARPVDTAIWNTKGMHYLYQYIVEKDTENRIDSWIFKNDSYYLRFKSDISTNDRIVAFEAIANKIKSQQVTASLGLLADDTKDEKNQESSNCVITFPEIKKHKAKLYVPQCEFHAIEKIQCDERGITITIADSYRDYLEVKNKIETIFSDLHIKKFVSAEGMLATNQSAFFSNSANNTASSVDIKYSPVKNILYNMVGHF